MNIAETPICNKALREWGHLTIEESKNVVQRSKLLVAKNKKLIAKMQELIARSQKFTF